VIDAPHRYPVDLIDVVRLAGRARVVLRPALPQDAELQRAFFRALSDQARYQRFMSTLGDIGHDLAAQLSAIDYESHVALLAEIFTDGGEIMVGEARYVVDDRGAGVCDFAIAVADGWRGTGLARLLLRRLVCHAAAAGLHRMIGDTLATNAAMIALAARAGFTAAVSPVEGRLVRLSKDLAADAPRPVCLAPGLRPSPSTPPAPIFISWGPRPRTRGSG
jgi:acetyltransferase